MIDSRLLQPARYAQGRFHTSRENLLKDPLSSRKEPITGGFHDPEMKRSVEFLKVTPIDFGLHAGGCERLKSHNHCLQLLWVLIACGPGGSGKLKNFPHVEQLLDIDFLRVQRCAQASSRFGISHIHPGTVSDFETSLRLQHSECLTQ